MKTLIAAGALALSTGVAQAQACFDHDALTLSLAMDGLTLHAAPLARVPGPAGYAPTEIYVAEDGRWVMLEVLGDGAACPVFIGEGWHLGEAT